MIEQTSKELLESVLKAAPPIAYGFATVALVAAPFVAGYVLINDKRSQKDLKEAAYDVLRNTLK